MSDVTFVQGDDAPPVRGQILKVDGTPFDLTGSTEVRFQMRKPDDRHHSVDAVADVVDNVTGKVRYEWAANDLSVPGDYIAQWQITLPDGRKQTTDPANTLTVRRQ